MKYYIGFGLLIITVLGLSLLRNSQSSEAFMTAKIFDKDGIAVWDQSHPQRIIIDHGVPQIVLGAEIPLYKSYLDFVKADKLSIWLDKGDGFQHYKDYPLSELNITEMFSGVSEEEKEKWASKNVSTKEVKIQGEMPPSASPMEHLQWRQLQKGGAINPSQILETRSIIKTRLDLQKKEKYLRDAGLNSWNFLGPGNIGGRVRAIAVKPRSKATQPYVIFVGAAGGGIWRSTDGGSTWNAINDFLPSLAVTSIVINPSNSNIMYAATGEGQSFTMGLPGAGIFKSVNGGTSWNQLSNTSNFYWVNKLAIHPTQTNVIFAVTSDADQNGNGSFGSIKKSTDGGFTWTTVTTNFNGGLTDIDIHPSNPSLITASGYSGLYLSTNGGMSFSYILTSDPVNNPTLIPDLSFGTKRIEIGMASSNSNTLYALVNNVTSGEADLYKSTNGGVDWNLTFSNADVFNHSGSAGSVGDYANTVWVDPLDENRVCFGGINLWRSTNGGTTASAISDWTEFHTASNQNSLHADQHILLEAPDYSVLNRTVFIGNDGGIQMTNNISTVTTHSGWINLCNTTLGTTQFYGGAVSLDGFTFGGGAQDASFSTGSSPFNWKQAITGDGSRMAISHANEDIMYANTNFNKLWKSSDKGLSWTDTIIGGLLPLELESDNAALISPFIMDPDNANRLFLGAEKLWRFNSNLNTFVDIKATVTPPSQPVVTVSAIDVRNTGQRLWVGYTDGTIEFSENGGTSWSGNLNNGNMPDNFVTDIAIRPSNFNLNKEAIVTLAGYNTNNIWLHAERFGNSIWTNISLPYALQVNCVTYNPANLNWIYVGTDLGIFASEDKGATWSITPIHGNAGSEYGNEGPVYTEVTDLFWSGDGGINGPYRLWATTFGRGLWRSNFVLDKIYVDKNASNDFGPGTISNPYKTLKTAASVAGHGATIVFLSNNDHNEAPSSVILDKRVMIDLTNGPVVIK